MHEVWLAIVDLVELETEVEDSRQRDLGLRQQAFALPDLVVDVDTGRCDQFVEQRVVIREAVIELGVIGLVANVDRADEVDTDPSAFIGDDAELQRARQALRVLVDTREACVAVSESNGSKPQRCLLYTSPSPRDGLLSRMPSSA